jgi:hypothetical protein
LQCGGQTSKKFPLKILSRKKLEGYVGVKQVKLGVGGEESSPGREN